MDGPLERLPQAARTEEDALLHLRRHGLYVASRVVLPAGERGRGGGVGCGCVGWERKLPDGG